MILCSTLFYLLVPEGKCLTWMLSRVHHDSDHEDMIINEKTINITEDEISEIDNKLSKLDKSSLKIAHLARIF